MKRGGFLLTRVINRLDRDTTGLLVPARHMLSACILSEQMTGRRIRREYRAIVLGHTPEEGTVNSPIARARGSTIERRVDHETGGKGSHPFPYSCSAMKKGPVSGESQPGNRQDTSDTGPHEVYRASASRRLLILSGLPVYQPSAPTPHLLRFEHPITGKEMEFTAGLL